MAFFDKDEVDRLLERSLDKMDSLPKERFIGIGATIGGISFLLLTIDNLFLNIFPRFLTQLIGFSGLIGILILLFIGFGTFTLSWVGLLYAFICKLIRIIRFLYKT